MKQRGKKKKRIKRNDENLISSQEISGTISNAPAFKS